MNSKRVILFDGVCNLCNASVQQLIKRDSERKLKYASLQSSYGQNLLNEMGWPQTDFDSFIYQRDNQVFKRSTAFLMVMRDLGGLYALLYPFILIPAFLRDPFYNLVAKYRYRIWGKRDECYVPTPELKSLFIED